MTDHFEILEHNHERILVRCGDSPLKTGVRDSDGLGACDEGVVSSGAFSSGAWVRRIKSRCRDGRCGLTYNIRSFGWRLG